MKLICCLFLSLLVTPTLASEIPAWQSYPKRGLANTFTYGFATPQAACANSTVPPLTSWQCSSPTNPIRNSALAACKDAMAAIAPSLAPRAWVRESPISRTLLCSTLTTDGSVYTAPGTCWISQLDPIPTEVGLTYNPGNGWCETGDGIPIYDVQSMKTTVCPGGGTWKLTTKPPLAPTYGTSTAPAYLEWWMAGAFKGFDPAAVCVSWGAANFGPSQNPFHLGTITGDNGPMPPSGGTAPCLNVNNASQGNVSKVSGDRCNGDFNSMPQNGQCTPNRTTCPEGYTLNGTQCIAPPSCIGDCPGTQTINVDTFWCDSKSSNNMSKNNALIDALKVNQSTTTQWMRYNGGL